MTLLYRYMKVVELDLCDYSGWFNFPLRADTIENLCPQYPKPDPDPLAFYRGCELDQKEKKMNGGVTNTTITINKPQTVF